MVRRRRRSLARAGRGDGGAAAPDRRHPGRRDPGPGARRRRGATGLVGRRRRRAHRHRDRERLVPTVRRRASAAVDSSPNGRRSTCRPGHRPRASDTIVLPSDIVRARGSRSPSTAQPGRAARRAPTSPRSSVAGSRCASGRAASSCPSSLVEAIVAARCDLLLEGPVDQADPLGFLFDVAQLTRLGDDADAWLPEIVEPVAQVARLADRRVDDVLVALERLALSADDERAAKDLAGLTARRRTDGLGAPVSRAPWPADRPTRRRRGRSWTGRADRSRPPESATSCPAACHRMAGGELRRPRAAHVGPIDDLVRGAVARRPAGRAVGAVRPCGHAHGERARPVVEQRRRVRRGALAAPPAAHPGRTIPVSTDETDRTTVRPHRRRRELRPARAPTSPISA